MLRAYTQRLPTFIIDSLFLLANFDLPFKVLDSAIGDVIERIFAEHQNVAEVDVSYKLEYGKRNAPIIVRDSDEGGLWTSTAKKAFLVPIAYMRLRRSNIYTGYWGIFRLVFSRYGFAVSMF